MKKAHTFATKHLYYLLSAGLLLTLIAAPFLMQADVTKNDNNCATRYDQDCDGALSPKGCAATPSCNAPAADWDDNDPNVGNACSSPGVSCP